MKKEPDLTPMFPVRFREMPHGTRKLVLSISYYRKWEREEGAEIFHQQQKMGEAYRNQDADAYHTARTLQDAAILRQSYLRNEWSPESAEIQQQRREEHRPLTLGEAVARLGLRANGSGTVQLPPKLEAACQIAAQGESERSERSPAALSSKVDTFEEKQLYVLVTRKVSLKNETEAAQGA